MPDASGACSTSVSLASFNLHCGVDGWGRPYDVVGVCRELDADVLVLQESWNPDGAELSTAEHVASRLGYRLVGRSMARGRLLAPNPAADGRFGPPLWELDHVLQVESRSSARDAGDAASLTRPSTPGSWELALLVRRQATFGPELTLRQLRRDPARRVVLSCSVRAGDRVLQVFGTHMSHLLHGSPRHYRQVRRALVAALGNPAVPAVLLGDMNLWGPLVVAQMPGWRRAVTGRTWPASHPHSQLDHVLVTPSVQVLETKVWGVAGSDHRPVRVEVTPGEP